MQASNVTRWNSEVIMIRSVLSIPADKLDQLNTQKLTYHECSLLTDLLEILSPLKNRLESIMLQNLPIMLFGISLTFCLLCLFLCFLDMDYADISCF